MTLKVCTDTILNACDFGLRSLSRKRMNLWRKCTRMILVCRSIRFMRISRGFLRQDRRCQMTVELSKMAILSLSLVISWEILNIKARIITQWYAVPHRLFIAIAMQFFPTPLILRPRFGRSLWKFAVNFTTKKIITGYRPVKTA